MRLDSDRRRPDPAPMPNPNPNATAAGVDRRADLISAVVRVIARRGYADTRFQDVADEAGVAVGTLQHHFGTRRRMLLEALQSWIDETDAEVKVLRTGQGDPWERLQMLLVYLGTRLGERVDSWRMWLDFLGAALRDPELRGSGRRSNLRWITSMAEVVREGEEAGVFEPVLPAEEVADVLGALFDGIALQIYSLDSDASGSELVERLIRTAEALLRPRTP